MTDKDIATARKPEGERFEAGQWVVCVDDLAQTRGLQSGSRYRVSSVDERYVYLLDEPGSDAHGAHGWYPTRFRPATPAEIGEAERGCRAPVHPHGGECPKAPSPPDAVAELRADLERSDRATLKLTAQLGERLLALEKRLDELTGGVVPQAVHEHGWQWRPIDDGAFAPPFGTVRVCRVCGCLVAGGPTVCSRCADGTVRAEGERPIGVTSWGNEIGITLGDGLIFELAPDVATEDAQEVATRIMQAFDERQRAEAAEAELATNRELIEMSRKSSKRLRELIIAALLKGEWSTPEAMDGMDNGALANDFSSWIDAFPSFAQQQADKEKRDKLAAELRVANESAEAWAKRAREQEEACGKLVAELVTVRGELAETKREALKLPAASIKALNETETKLRAQYAALVEAVDRADSRKLPYEDESGIVRFSLMDWGNIVFARRDLDQPPSADAAVSPSVVDAARKMCRAFDAHQEEGLGPVSDARGELGDALADAGFRIYPGPAMNVPESPEGSRAATGELPAGWRDCRSEEAPYRFERDDDPQAVYVLGHGSRWHVHFPGNNNELIPGEPFANILLAAQAVDRAYPRKPQPEPAELTATSIVERVMDLAIASPFEPARQEAVSLVNRYAQQQVTKALDGYCDVCGGTVCSTRPICVGCEMVNSAPQLESELKAAHETIADLRAKAGGAAADAVAKLLLQPQLASVRDELRRIERELRGAKL